MKKRSDKLTVAEAVGMRIREIRFRRGLTQDELAVRAKCDRTYISGIENGHRNITIDVLMRICQGLEVNLLDFVDNPIFEELYEVES